MSAPETAQDFVYVQEGLEFEDRDRLETLANKVFGPLRESRTDEWGSREER
jgi:hypothetical protein